MFGLFVPYYAKTLALKTKGSSAPPTVGKEKGGSAVKEIPGCFDRPAYAGPIAEVFLIDDCSFVVILTVARFSLEGNAFSPRYRPRISPCVRVVSRLLGPMFLKAVRPPL